MAIEKASPAELIEKFTARIQAAANENEQLRAKLRENESIILKLQGAVETLQYLESGGGEEVQEEPTTETPSEE
jgi:hypothetical protein